MSRHLQRRLSAHDHARYLELEAKRDDLRVATQVHAANVAEFELRLMRVYGNPGEKIEVTADGLLTRSRMGGKK